MNDELEFRSGHARLVQRGGYTLIIIFATTTTTTSSSRIHNNIIISLHTSVSFVLTRSNILTIIIVMQCLHRICIIILCEQNNGHATLSRRTFLSRIKPRIEEAGRAGFYFFPHYSLFFVLPLAGAISARWHVARGALLPECRRRCIFRGDRRTAFGRTDARARAPIGCTSGCGDTRAHARITQVCSVIVAVAVTVDDLLVITRPHRTQLCLPTPQSISQGTRRTRNPPLPHRRRIRDP